MLVNCKECSHAISDKANSCPSCGFPIKNIKPYVVKNKEGFFLKSMNFGCLFFFCFILFGLIWIVKNVINFNPSI